MATSELAGRPKIDLSGGDLHRKVDEAWAALVAANDEREPRLLVRGNELVRMTERGELEPYTVNSLRDVLSRVADCGVWGEEGFVPRDPPQDLARLLLDRDSAEYEGAPRVDRVVDAPVLAANGTLVTTPGHHAGSRLFYRPAPELEDVRPTEVELVDDVVAARDLLLNDLLGDFAWADEASKANALGLLLLPFVRDFIADAPTPMHVIMAPEPGTGKTLLAQTALMPGCGYVPVTAGDRSHNDEWRKSLTASLLRGARAIVFDNLSEIDSGPLAAALTTGVWRDRVLGYSREVTLPIRNAWVATGNNMRLSDEQARRAVAMFLDPGETRPSDRPKDDFRHPDLLGWARANRPALTEAALTLIRNWLEGEVVHMNGDHTLLRNDGVHVASERTLGSFERWAEVVGGILAAADVVGFLGNRDRLYVEANEERHEVATFLAAWHAVGGEPVELAQLVTLCRIGGALHAHLPVALAGVREADLPKKLSYWLRQNRDRRFDGYQLLRQDGRPRRWSVRSAG